MKKRSAKFVKKRRKKKVFSAVTEIILIKAVSVKENTMNFPKDKKMQLYARTLRNNPTKEENHLWYDYLRKYPVRFYRQKNIGDVVVDFYCKKARLAVNLSQHIHGRTHSSYDDIKRHLASYGIQLISFENKLIWHNFGYVCRVIDSCVQRRCPEEHIIKTLNCNTLHSGTSDPQSSHHAR